MPDNHTPALLPKPRRGRWDSVPIAFVWRYLTHSLMLLIAMFAERIPGPQLSDRVLSVTPYIPLIANYNYHIWTICYIPIALWMWRIDRRRFVEFLYAGGILSVLRGGCIWLTTLGPVRGPDVNAGKPLGELISAWVDLINPISGIFTDVAQIYLTKDLFFSGHTASTFLLLLYCWRIPQLRSLSAAGHIIVVTSVFFSHLHYSIDVVGGWMAAYVVYAICEKFFSRYEHT